MAGTCLCWPSFLRGNGSIWSTRTWLRSFSSAINACFSPLGPSNCCDSGASLSPEHVYYICNAQQIDQGISRAERLVYCIRDICVLRLREHVVSADELRPDCHAETFSSQEHDASNPVNWHLLSIGVRHIVESSTALSYSCLGRTLEDFPGVAKQSRFYCSPSPSSISHHCEAILFLTASAKGSNLPGPPIHILASHSLNGFHIMM